MGLFRTAARASVAAHVVGNVHRRQNQRWATEDASAAKQAQAQPPVPGAAPAATQPPATMPVPATNLGQSVDARLEQLTKLGQLRDSGILTPEEFEAQKQQILTAS